MDGVQSPQSDPQSTNSETVSRDYARDVVLISGAGVCWLACTIAQVEKYLALSLAIPLCVFGLAFVAGIFLLLKRAYRKRGDASYWALIAAFLLLTASFAVLYPRSRHHTAGMGSDREDALRVEIQALTHHAYPYDARTFRGNRPTPLPGAMLLAAPFYLLGKVAFQNLFWAGSFIWFAVEYFRSRYTALAFVLLFLIAALENLNDFDVGGDYLANIMYVSVAIYFFAKAAESRRTGWRTLLSVVLLGVALSSRVIYLVTVPPLLAYAIQRGSLRRGLSLIGSVVAISAAVTLPVFAPYPFTRFITQLHQNSDKLQLLPAYLPAWSLVAAAFLVSAISFAIRMTMPRIFMFAGLATLIMLLPPMALFVSAEGGLLHRLTPDLEYLAISAIFLALWIFSAWERAHAGSNQQTADLRLSSDNGEHSVRA